MTEFDKETGLFQRLARALSGKYELERELGRGGMATVFLAHEQKHKRRVVIKVLKPEMAAWLGAERFLREVHIIARLGHPNILGLIDSGESDGFLYYVMPHVGGETLRDHLQKSAEVSVEQTITVLRDIASALSYAHREGVVHRDLKPANVLWAQGHAYLMDFGIAKLRDTEPGQRDLTEIGAAIGTPAYMAPEQRISDPALDHRADLYSWGVVAHEMLTGRLPMASEKAGEIDADSIRALRPDVPVSLAQLISSTLALDPDGRPATAAVVVADLDRVLESPVYLHRRAMSVWALVATGVAVLLLGAGVLWWKQTRTGAETGTRLPLPIAVLSFSNETGDTTLNTWGRMAGDWVTEGLQTTELVSVVPWPTSLRANDRIAAEVRGGHTVDPVAMAREETGAGTIITGSYYLVGDSLTFRAEVNDAVRGRLLASIPPIRASRERPEAGIDALRQRIMGMIALYTDDRLGQVPGLARRPPTFEAYQIFDAALDQFRDQNYSEALVGFRRAFAADTEFMAALLNASIAAWNVGNLPLADSLVQDIRERQNQLGDFQRVRFEALQALLVGDGEGEVEALRRASRLAPATMSTHNLAIATLSTDRPAEALAALETLDPEHGDMRGWSSYWTQLTHALHLLGQHERELEAARKLEQLYPDRRVGLALEVRALAALGRPAAIDSALYTARALTPTTYWSQGAAMVVAGEELTAHGFVDEGAKYLQRGRGWLEQQLKIYPGDVNHRYWMGSVLYDLAAWKESALVFRRLSTEAPDRLDYRGLAAVAAARTGDARAEDRLGDANPSERGTLVMYRARLAAIRGDHDAALTLFSEAVRRGLRGLPWVHAAAFRDLAPFRNDQKALPLSLRTETTPPATAP